jgi:Uma2 family endonuclease
MVRPAPQDAAEPTGYTTDAYFALAASGAFGSDERVELLEGVVVSMAPHNPPHAAGVRLAEAALHRAVGASAVVQVQLSLVAGKRSVPEPDVAVLPGRLSDYLRAHPTTALLVVEVADSSLIQDRLTKVPIYASAGIPEVWIVNLREDRVEVFRDPVRTARRYATTTLAEPGGRLELAALPGVSVAVDDLLPSRYA